MRILPYTTPEDIDRLHGKSTALHVACIDGSASIVQLLIWVCCHGCVLSLSRSLSSLVSLSSQNRGNINQLDIFNRPPLYYARHHDYTTIENILIASNCVVDDLSRLSLSSDGGSSEALHRTRSS